MRLTLVALSLSLLSAPVSASAQAAQGPASKAKAPAPKETIYCLEFEPGTGSRISRRECNTKARWETLGIDIDKLGKQ